MSPCTPIEFSLSFQSTPLQGNHWQHPDSRATALVLHGGGSSSAAGFGELRDFLYQRQISSIAFDHFGHGKSGGSQLGSTLAQRVAQVGAVIEQLALRSEQLSLIGFSMGAYVAALAAQAHAIPRLGLAIPAAYASAAYHVPFGPDFSQILRTPRSWENSDAFDIIAGYRGHLLVVSAEQDAVVPAEIPARYHQQAGRSASRHHHQIAGAGHNLSLHFAELPQARIDAYEKIVALCLRENT